MNNNDIVNQVEQLCGETTLLENGWYCFMYRHLHFLNIPDSKNGMIRISIPHICKDCEFEKEELEKAINETNREVKYVKIMILNNGSISLNYDHKISDRDKASEIVPHMIMTLYSASEYFMFKLKVA